MSPDKKGDLIRNMSNSRTLFHEANEAINETYDHLKTFESKMENVNSRKDYFQQNVRPSADKFSTAIRAAVKGQDQNSLPDNIILVMDGLLQMNNNMRLSLYKIETALQHPEILRNNSPRSIHMGHTIRQAITAADRLKVLLNEVNTQAGGSRKRKHRTEKKRREKKRTMRKKRTHRK
jgi:hypothetical protein